MGRSRRGTVLESPAELKDIIQAGNDSLWVPRIRMLELLRSSPSTRLADLADELRVNERTIRRWWKRYLDHGLEGLLADVPPHLWNSPARVASRGMARERIVAETVIAFLNLLPTANDAKAWIEAVKTGLERLLRVERVTISVNINVDLDHQSAPKPGRGRPRKRRTVGIVQHGMAERDRTTVSAERWEGARVDRVLEGMRKGRFPMRRYHPPVGFDYYHESGQAIGTIILWQGRSLPAIPERTRALMEELRPFFTFLLTDCIARRPRDLFDVRTFTSIVMRMAEQTGLSQREREILIPHILGRNVEQIAELLGIATRTVKAHITAINRKSGCRTSTELFARYLTPVDDRTGREE